MHDPRLLIALALILGGLVAFDHLRKTKTGGARTRLTTLPEKQPGGFRRYFHSDWTVLGLCARRDRVRAALAVLGACHEAHTPLPYIRDWREQREVCIGEHADFRTL